MLYRIPNVLTHIVLLLAISTILTAGENNAVDKEKERPKEFEVSVKKGKGMVTISSTGKSGYHCNTLYPWKLTVSKDGNKNAVYKQKDAKEFSKQKVVFEVPYKNGESATLKLSVCNDMQCIMHEAKLSW